MSKRQEIRARRRRAQIRNRIIVILAVVAGAALIVFVLILPSLGQSNSAPSASATIAVITPRAFNAKVDGLHLGDANAPVKIDVWEDFQCSACLNYTEAVEPQVLTNLIDTGKVYYTFHFFFTIDQGSTGESHQAANAALCANDQGHFWDYHDMLFTNNLGENVGSFTNSRLEQMAKDIGLNTTTFNACFQANKHKSQIDQDAAAGLNKGVSGTPSVFVNGTIVTPGNVPTYDQIAQAVASAGGK